MKWTAWIVVVVLTGGCQRPAPEAVVVDELEAASVTRWTGRTELFAEYPPLVVGQTSRFAIHLTRLDTFKALTEGRVEVRLTGGGAPAESFPIEGPSRPGIFGVDVVPAHGGSRELTIVLRHPGLDDEHAVGGVAVHKDDATARAAAGVSDEGGAEAISFLKEQQWALDFGTSVVETASVRESMRVAAAIVARPGGAADVAAPSDGRLTRVADLPPGAPVTRGQELARIQPPASAVGDLSQLLQAQAEASSVVQVATRDRERAERLLAAGAAPQKRLDDARAVEEQARARAIGADARLGLYQAARTAGTAPMEDGQFVLRSPVAGVVAERTATAGASVLAGAVLYRIVDIRQVHVTGQIPEAQLRLARQRGSAEIEVPGGATRAVGRLVGFGGVLDPRTRTVPVAFALDNSVLGLVVGQSVFLHLLGHDPVSGPVVPASAIVDDAGRPIVFVQADGESFERRAVTLGARSGNRVQVLNGVKAGERVVTTGAYLVRLASLSTQVPAHGHVH